MVAVICKTFAQVLQCTNWLSCNLPNFYNFFDTIHDPETKRYFGEDFGFCQRWTDMGGKVYLYIMDYITHVGEHQFCGRFFDNLKPAIDDKKKIK